MSEHKDTVMRYLRGVQHADHELVLSLVTDDVLLERKGRPGIRGKEVLRAVIDDEDGAVHRDTGSHRPVHRIERMVEEGDTVVVSGSVVVRLLNGGRLETLFCDHFTFSGGLISGLESYMVPPAGPLS
ncbi:nuclear transport factor 2 family protein [Streptomyces sp. NP-1717]|uniref:nuclear transport factor 2 family protein n=1 Tax=unclassified Streptomyces TaxID=2593676 RepID=UPI001F5C511C|nr:nuclear transport factor 2 family protein [Streptomyces sp. NP-1717]MCI3221339.1 nuclear transport factor 2 family protein [Streptomyces sp. NP-1717]WTA71603.1 nuclear transport factor 2 family protein [Streptomyces sp. NBC_00838]